MSDEIEWRIMNQMAIHNLLHINSLESEQLKIELIEEILNNSELNIAFVTVNREVNKK